jgi:hypothetical protein
MPALRAAVAVICNVYNEMKDELDVKHQQAGGPRATFRSTSLSRARTRAIALEARRPLRLARRLF